LGDLSLATDCRDNDLLSDWLLSSAGWNRSDVGEGLEILLIYFYSGFGKNFWLADVFKIWLPAA
jgi:hypothetical protein